MGQSLSYFNSINNLYLIRNTKYKPDCLIYKEKCSQIPRFPGRIIFDDCIILYDYKYHAIDYKLQWKYFNQMVTRYSVSIDLKYIAVQYTTNNIKVYNLILGKKIPLETPICYKGDLALDIPNYNKTIGLFKFIPDVFIAILNDTVMEYALPTHPYWKKHTFCMGLGLKYNLGLAAKDDRIQEVPNNIWEVSNNVRTDSKNIGTNALHNFVNHYIFDRNVLNLIFQYV